MPGLFNGASGLPFLPGGLQAQTRNGGSGLSADPLWTPYLFGTALRGWFDARNTASITQAAGAVSAWASLVNSWSVVQATGASQPSVGISTIWNNRQTINFSAGQNIERTPLSLEIYRNRGGGTIAASLHYATLPTSDSAPIFVSTSGSGSTRAAIGSVGPTTLWGLRGRRLDADALTGRSSATAIVAATPYLAVGSFDWAGGSAYMHVNGAEILAPGAWTSAGLVENTGEARVALGAAAQPWSGGRLGNVLLINRLMTADERQRWEGYEAYALGLQATLLPSNHPYQRQPPLASLEEREAFADTLRDIDFTFPAERERAAALYVPIRGLVQGWRVAA